MATFPTFRHVTVHRPIPDAIQLRWSLVPHDWPLDDLGFVIFRANTPQGPWEEVGHAEEGAMHFVDYGVYAPAVLRNYYYVVRAASKTGGKNYIDSSWVDCRPEQDHIATELIRKKQVFLMTRGGCQGAILVKKTWGALCSRCYNHQKMLASDPDCPNCFGTGYTGGYLQPMYLPALINPPKKAIVAADIVYDPRQIYAEVGFMPQVNPDDIFVDVKMNIRYKVQDVSPSSHRQVVVSQILLLLRADENDDIYSIPVPEVNPNSYVGRSWDLVQPRIPDWSNRNVSDYAVGNASK